MNNSKYRLLAAAIATAIVCFMIWVASVDFKSALLSGASAVLGVLIADFVSASTMRDLANKIRDDANDTFGARVDELISVGTTSVLSLKEDTRAFAARPWYFYYVTRMDGALFWRQVTIRLEAGPSGVHLRGNVSLMNKDGTLEPYSIEAGVRDYRFFLVLTAEDDDYEPALIAVFAIETMRSPKGGALFLRTWDESHKMIAPCVLSPKPLVDSHPDQRAISGEQSNALNALWTELFRDGLGEIFPLPRNG